jgi:hypothetical protein
MSEENRSIAADILRGAKAIGEFIGEDERRTHYLLDQGLIPAGKEGAGTWISFRSKLREYYYGRISAGNAGK